jgi:hypothetical protein
MAVALPQVIPPEADLDFILFIPAVGLGTVACVMGVLGLRRLARAGKGPPVSICESGVERLASRLAASAGGMGRSAVVVGLIVVLVGSVFGGLSWWSIGRRRHFQSLPRYEAAEDRLFWGVRQFVEGHPPWRVTPESELARRLRTILTEYGDGRTAHLIRESPQSPYAEYRRILARHPSDLDALTRLAIRDLEAAMFGKDLATGQLAVWALSEMPGPPADALEALRRAAATARWDVNAVAQKALNKIGK